MNTQDIISSWRWRIVRAGYNASSFAKLTGISQGIISEYLTGKKSPSLKRFEMIENKIKELEEKNGSIT